MSGNEDGEVAISLQTPAAIAMARTNIEKSLPFLRRYARALTGSQHAGDAVVRIMLHETVANADVLAQAGNGQVGLYAVFSELMVLGRFDHYLRPDNSGAAFEQRVQQRLANVSTLARQALLLTQLEEFSVAEAGEILKLSADETERLVSQAILEIERDAATSVLIIEDEPLISSHIDAIVSEMGHRVVAIAATATQANAAYAAHQPGLVLADIQLADGSSGLTVVDDILALGAVPIIFITAFPEKLLTGARPEPSFLIAKPFREETLRATISQALFFGANFNAQIVS